MLLEEVWSALCLTLFVLATNPSHPNVVQVKPSSLAILKWSGVQVFLAIVLAPIFQKRPFKHFSVKVLTQFALVFSLNSVMASETTPMVWVLAESWCLLVVSVQSLFSGSNVPASQIGLATLFFILSALDNHSFPVWPCGLLTTSSFLQLLVRKHQESPSDVNQVERPPIFPFISIWVIHFFGWIQYSWLCVSVVALIMHMSLSGNAIPKGGELAFAARKVIRAQFLMTFLSLSRDFEGCQPYFNTSFYVMAIVLIIFVCTRDSSPNHLDILVQKMLDWSLRALKILCYQDDLWSQNMRLIPLRFQSRFRKSLVKIPDLESCYQGVESLPEQEFRSLKLTHYPKIADTRSHKLTSSVDVVLEAQRVHENIFQELLGPFAYAIIFDLADYENKGDPAIALGEIILLKKLGVQLLYYCKTSECSEMNIQTAYQKFKDVSPHEMVILLQGGGNLFSYEFVDIIRERVIERFKDHKILIFPQSIWLRYPDYKLDHYRRVYNSHPELTILLRDRVSYAIGEQMLPGCTLILCPDLAFQIGTVPRVVPATFDILWQKRDDDEGLGYSVPKIPDHISCHVGDWREWLTPKTAGMEHIWHLTFNGLQFLQRGKVIITDRLHGHILATLLGIPHVIVNNNYGKVLNYHRSWTRSLEFVKVANSPEEALESAMVLLKTYQIDGNDNDIGYVSESGGVHFHLGPKIESSSVDEEHHRKLFVQGGDLTRMEVDFWEYTLEEDEALGNLTRDDLLEKVSNLERQLDFYIPMYWSLVVVLFAIAFFICVLIIPERRRTHFRELIRVEYLEQLNQMITTEKGSGAKSIDDNLVGNVDNLGTTLERDTSSLRSPNSAQSLDDIESQTSKGSPKNRTEVLLSPRTLPDFQEIASYDHNSEPIYMTEAIANETESQDNSAPLKPDSRRKATKDASKTPIQDFNHDMDEHYQVRPETHQSDADYKYMLEATIPGVMVTRPSDDRSA
eukprot:maker-scaffold335_size202896-snap-gene-1.26 protein:Tk05631 transcript:maker-scaffold335_size202896-snap-gene-1.26-mRNA-1 annotation:"hypothetical protein LOTGIDRAFT_173601"